MLLGFTLARTFDLPGHLTAWADLGVGDQYRAGSEALQVGRGGAVVVALLFIVLSLL
jgi:hypothetical protein